MPRIEVAVTPADGQVDVHNVGRPAVLAAFGDKFGKTAPTTYSELAWLAHRTLARDEPLEAWLESLDELTADPRALARAKREVQGRRNPVERLEAMTAAELVELVEADGTPPPFEQLLVEVRAQLEADRVEAERFRAALEARARIDSLSDAELEQLPEGELDRLRELAESVPDGGGDELEPVPTTPAPATAGAIG